MNIGSAIRDLRRGQDLTLETVAKKAKLSVSQLSLMERGERSMSIEALGLIAKALDIPVPVIVYWASEPGELSHLTPAAKKAMDEIVTRILRDRMSRKRENKKKSRSAAAESLAEAAC